MANNALFVTCKICGKGQIIGKYYPTSWFYPWGAAKLGEDLLDFINKHLHEELPEFDGNFGTPKLIITDTLEEEADG